MPTSVDDSWKIEDGTSTLETDADADPWVTEEDALEGDSADGRMYRDLWDVPLAVASPVEKTMMLGAFFKKLVIDIGAVAVVALAIYTIVSYKVSVGILLLIFGPPIWMLVADLATGVLLALVVGVVALFSRD
jgi:hypothetical protein